MLVNVAPALRFPDISSRHGASLRIDLGADLGAHVDIYKDIDIGVDVDVESYRGTNIEKYTDADTDTAMYVYTNTSADDDFEAAADRII